MHKLVAQLAQDGGKDLGRNQVVRGLRLTCVEGRRKVVCGGMQETYKPMHMNVQSWVAAGNVMSMLVPY